MCNDGIYMLQSVTSGSAGLMAPGFLGSHFYCDAAIKHDLFNNELKDEGVSLFVIRIGILAYEEEVRPFHGRIVKHTV